MVKQHNPSRFSTLKVFNFAAGSKPESNGEPPPPPPKDRYYLFNKSMSSLSPDSFSMPTTPLSPGFKPGGSPPAPSHSTVDLHEFGGSVSPPASSIKSSAPSKRSLFSKLSSKRSQRSTTRQRPPLDEAVPRPPSEDDGISLPWNFQHNIHVDEGYSGLPPSWSASLVDAGFNDDEIAAIQARRANNPSPGPYISPHTPVMTNGCSHNPPHTNGRVLANPQPRSTSLRQLFSDTASIASSSRGHRVPPPPLQATIPPVPLIRQPSQSSQSQSQYHYSDSSSFDAGHPESQYVYINSRNELSSHAPSESSHVSSEARADSPTEPINIAPQSRPRTPPKRTFRVMNESPSAGLVSPPPAYRSPAPNSTYAAAAAEKHTHREEPQLVPQPEAPRLSIETNPAVVPESAEEQDDNGTDEDETVTLPPAQDRGQQLLTTLPPRLSLHEASEDLDSWSESLFSAIPSATGSTLSPPTSSTLSPSLSVSLKPPPTSASTSGTAPKPSSSSPTSSSRQPSIRRGAPQKPVPATPLEQLPEEDYIAPPPNGGLITPLWNEIMEMVQPPLSASTNTPTYTNTSPFTPPFTPALDELNSPTLPVTLMPNIHAPHEEEEDRDEEDEEGEEEGDDDDVYLRLEKRDSTRDSNLSNVTVTGATIVRNASIATRARANVIDRSATRKRSVNMGGSQTHGSVEEEVEDDDEEEEEEEEEELVFPPTPSPIRAGFAVGDTTPRNPSRHYKAISLASGALSAPSLTPPPAPGSPHSSCFSESSSSGSESESRSSSSHAHSRNTLLEDTGNPPPLPPKEPELAYLRSSSISSPLPTPIRATFGEHLIPPRDTFGSPANGDPDSPSRTDSLTMGAYDLLPKPSIVINGVDRQVGDMTKMASESPKRISPPAMAAIPSMPPTPSRRYQGWLSKVMVPLQEFIDEDADPRELYFDLQEIAEAESGSVYAARVTKPDALGLSPDVSFVAIKNIPILPSGSHKLVDLRKELTLTRGVLHENVLTMDALYVDLVEDSLWIRMELMERSLADVVGLVAEGLMVQERMIARFASDVLLALEYLQKQHIAHRDVRSDNLLLNKDGVLKIADFSNAVQVTSESPVCTDAAGVIYWQAPEMRNGGPYNVLKVDVWSLGATVWETAQASPPFAEVQDPRLIGDRWPSLHQPEIYSRSFHEFLRLCSEPSASRPNPSELLNTLFIRNACGRPVNVHLLSQCRAIEETMLEQGNAVDL